MIYEHPYDIVTEDIFLGLRSLVRNAEVYLKIEGLNPSGSIKLKTALALIEDAEERGVLTAGGRVIESSSGNLGVALAGICAARGYHFTCVVDPNISAPNRAHIRAFGAEVVVVDQVDANGGYLHSRLAYIRERLRSDSRLVWPNQYANPANARAHYRRTARALVDELGQVDYLFVGAGSTGTLTGMTEYVRDHSPGTQVIAVDTVGSVTFSSNPGPRHIPGLGASRRPELCRPDLVDAVVLIPELEAIRACRQLANDTGLLVGGSTGSALAAVVQCSDWFEAAQRVAVISPDLGDRYLRTIYDDNWVRATYGALPEPIHGSSERLATTGRG